MGYILHIGILIGLYIIIAQALNLTYGFSGLMNLSSAAFYGIGAYSYALLTLQGGFPPIFSLMGAVGITSAIALLLGIPALRLRKDSFFLVTLGFQIIIGAVLFNWVGLTRGPYGIPGIPRPVILGWSVNRPWEFLLVLCVVLLIAGGFLFLIFQTPFGLSLKALRDDERGAMALGKSPFRQFLLAFVVGSGMMAIPGAFYASYATYIDPGLFGIDESIYQIVILSLGGSGNRKGPIVGVLVMVIIPEILRVLQLPSSIAFNLRQILYGIMLVILMTLRPKGLAGEYSLK